MEYLQTGWEWLTKSDCSVIGLILFIVILGWVIFRWEDGVLIPRPKKDWWDD